MRSLTDQQSMGLKLLHKHFLARARKILILLRGRFLPPSQKRRAVCLPMATTLTNLSRARVKLKKETILAPHFVLYVRDQLVDKYGEEFIEQGGLKVITTLDWRLQQIAEEEIKKGAEYNEKQYQGKNAALVAQDPKTGQILAMVGSRDYFDETVDGNVNVALRARQPGSSFKPIVYGAAFAKGFTPDTLLWDVVTTFKVEPKDYTPHNYDNKEHGLVSIRQALAGSLNIPAVKTIYLTGIGRVLDLADKLGYTTLTDRSRFGLSLVLGGGEVKLVEHVGAFAAFANDGKHTPQSALLRIEDSSGRVLEEWEAPRVKQVVDPAVVRELISVLSDNAARAFIFGSNSPLILKDRPVAEKTGRSLRISGLLDPKIKARAALSLSTLISSRTTAGSTTCFTRGASHSSSTLPEESSMRSSADCGVCFPSLANAANAPTCSTSFTSPPPSTNQRPKRLRSVSVVYPSLSARSSTRPIPVR